MIYNILYKLISYNKIKYLALSIYDYNNLLKDHRCPFNLEINYLRSALLTGHYANLLESEIHVSKDVDKENIKVGIFNNDKISWSPNINIDILTESDKLDKILKNKAFW